VVLNETPSRLSPAKCALLVGIQVLLVVVCMAVIIREILVAEVESSETMLLKESSGTAGLRLEEQSRLWAGPPVQATSSEPLHADQILRSSEKLSEDSLPDCVETGKTKMAKAVWVFVAGALLNSERARSIIVAGAL
jgi:hypothetical protein